MVSSAAKIADRRGSENRLDPMRVAAAIDRLNQEGITAEAWAREHGESAWTVRKVLSGTRACRFGAAHRVAVKLGIKDGVVTSEIVHA